MHDYSVLTEDTETNPKVPKFKVDDRVNISKYKNIFSKAYAKYWSREKFVIDSVMKTNPQAYKIKRFKGEKIIASSHENDLLLSILSMSNYPEPYSHIRDSSIVLVKITKPLKDN